MDLVQQQQQRQTRSDDNNNSSNSKDMALALEAQRVQTIKEELRIIETYHRINDR
ncbi:MAG: hypothetical protein WBL68_10550 [Nitrososphaeraceae archaeon]